MKQTGLIIDTSSERCLSKEWDGLLIESFNIDDRKIKYTGAVNSGQQVQDAKESKKKESKNPKA